MDSNATHEVAEDPETKTNHVPMKLIILPLGLGQLSCSSSGLFRLRDTKFNGPRPCRSTIVRANKSVLPFLLARSSTSSRNAHAEQGVHTASSCTGKRATEARKRKARGKFRTSSKRTFNIGGEGENHAHQLGQRRGSIRLF